VRASLEGPDRTHPPEATRPHERLRNFLSPIVRGKLGKGKAFPGSGLQTKPFGAGSHQESTRPRPHLGNYGTIENGWARVANSIVREEDKPTVTTANEEIRFGGIAVRFLLEGKSSGGSVAMFEFDVAAGTKVPIAHSHDAYEETIYGLEGVLTFTVNGQKTAIGPGQVLCIPRGAVHRFDNYGPADTKTLAIVTPGVLGPDYFREIAAVVAKAAGSPPDPTAIAEVMRRHGLTPAP
jgi:quercetin dioxygenase-like cupin family protein